MEKHMFENFPVFKLSDLAGKTLIIRVAGENGYKIIVGYEKSTGKIYVLGEEYKQ